METTTDTYTVLKSDKEKGVKLLFELYAQKLFNYATYNWKTEPDATWELIYKTIYKVADVIDQYEFENELKFTAFLFRIFINNLKDYVRKQKNQAKSLKEVELSENIINNYQAGTTATLPNNNLKLLELELEKLADWQRILLLMRAQDMSYKEISRYVNKPENQLKIYYSRLKKQLLQRLNELLNKPGKNENA